MLAERARERERARAAQQRAVEVEERGGGHGRHESTVSGLRIVPWRAATTASAIAKIARADSESGSASTTGTPRSPASRSAGSSGIVPSSETPSSLGEPRAAARAERLAGHVLDHAEQAQAGLLRHHGRPRGDLLRERLRRRHDDHLGARQELAERDRHVPGPGRHVDDDRVELAPVHVGEELLERAMEHRAAPHERRVVVHEVADRDELEPAADGRDDHLVDDDGPLVDPEHVRDRVAVDVRVDQPDRLPERVEREGEVDGERRLADAALAAGDRDHARARVERDRLLGPAAAELRRQRRLLLGAHHVEAQLDAAHARQRADVLGDLLLERRAQRAADDRQRDRDGHVRAVELDRADHVELGDRLAQLGVDDALERLEDRVAVGVMRSGYRPTP